MTVEWIPRDEKLFYQARNLASQRGHKIGAPQIPSAGSMVGICEYCGATAAVDTSPPPGGPEIFGTANVYLIDQIKMGEVFND